MNLRWATGVIFSALVFSVHGEGAPPAGDPAKGESIATKVCSACHGPDGNSPAPANPKLAGQHAEYTAKQLANFKPQDGKPPERQNPIMAGMAASLSADDIRDVAVYFERQKPQPRAARDPKLVRQGQAIYRGGIAVRGVAACTGCHGPTGAGIPAQFPRLAGQYAEYTALQLKAFRNGERGNDPNRMMRTIAERLSDQEIAALADYIAGLH
jgi:cytochrome c553